MRFGVLCLVAFAVLPSLSRAQVPVFAISQEGAPFSSPSRHRWHLRVSSDKWEATITFPSTDVTTGVTDIKIQAASVNTGSGMKDDSCEQDFFNAKDDPYITFHSTRLCRPVPTLLIFLERLPFVVSLSPRH